MAGFDVHRRRRRLRRALGAAAIIVSPAIVIMHAANLSGAAPVSAGRITAAHVTVQPQLSTFVAPVHPVTSTRSPSAPTAAFAKGNPSASADMAMHVRVLPGKAQWLADAAPSAAADDNTRILSGTVLYAIGDNHAWQLVVHISGADGHIARPRCSAVSGSPPIAGDEAAVGIAPITVCQGAPARSGGIFSIALDLDGTVSGDITVTVDLIP